jgi:hypothetical protein
MSDETVDAFTFRTRAESLRASKRRRLDDAFRGRKWEIVHEIRLPRAAPGEHQQMFRTEFGQWGRHGYVIRDVESGKQIVVGNGLLKIIAQRYQGVTLPVRRRGRPPKNRTAAPA